jgi:hypothetical protein
MPNWLDTLTDYAHKAGQAVRDVTAGAREAYNDLAPAVENALKFAKAIQAGEAKKVLDGYMREVLAQTNSLTGWLQDAAQQLVAAANGAPPSVAGRLVVYSKVQKAASDKKAFGLPEVVACEEHVKLIQAAVERYKADPNKDETECSKLGDEFEVLMEKASKEIAVFDCDEATLKRKVANTALTLGEIDAAEHARGAAETEYTTVILNAQLPAATAGIPTVDSLKARVAEAEADITAGQFGAAAVKLHTWEADASTILADKRNATKKLKQLSNAPVKLKGRLQAALAGYEEKNGPIDDKTNKDKRPLAELYVAANGSTKVRPFDEADCKAKIDTFEQAIQPYVS